MHTAQRARHVSILVAVCFAMAGCGGSESGAVSVEWRLEASDDAVPNSYETVVHLRNDSGETIRNATLRFSPGTSANVPAGVSIGTISGVSSRFEGAVQAWALGDIAPETDVVFPVGLWFDNEHNVVQSHPVELVMELHSPDLEDRVVSNALSVTLRP